MAFNIDKPPAALAPLPPGINLMAKPAGFACNIRCKYCFYLDTAGIYPEQQHPRMSNEVLEAYVKACVSLAVGNPEGPSFTWQGGEPTLAGLDFFRRAVALEKQYCGATAFRNALQTNGLLLDDRWCEFLAANGFLVGLSLDGSQPVHDRYRRTAKGEGTFRLVMRALHLLQKHGVEYNVLATVARHNEVHALQSYRFLRDNGARFIQFIPVAGHRDSAAGSCGGRAMHWSVDSETLGDAWVSVFDEWVRHDVGKVFVLNFEWLLHGAVCGDAPVCTMKRQCGKSLVVEHNGDVYACDHFVSPEYRVGNLLADQVVGIVTSEAQRAFGVAKETTLAGECKACDVLHICRGGCPRERFASSPGEDASRSVLCAAYKKLFRHYRKYAEGMATLLRYGYPARVIMQAIDRPVMLPGNARTGGRPAVLWIK